MKEEQKPLTVAQANHIYKCVFADAKSRACNVMYEYFVVSYQGFLPISVLQPILDRLMTGYKVVLLRNRSELAYDRAINRAIKAVCGRSLLMEY